MQTLKRIGVGSAFRVGFAVSALLFLVLGFFVLFLPGLFGRPCSSATTSVVVLSAHW